MNNYQRFMRKPSKERIRIMKENERRICERCGKEMRAKDSCAFGEYTLCKKCKLSVKNDGAAMMFLIGEID